MPRMSEKAMKRNLGEVASYKKIDLGFLLERVGGVENLFSVSDGGHSPNRISTFQEIREYREGVVVFDRFHVEERGVVYETNPTSHEEAQIPTVYGLRRTIVGSHLAPENPT